MQRIATRLGRRSRARRPCASRVDQPLHFGPRVARRRAARTFSAMRDGVPMHIATREGSAAAMRARCAGNVSLTNAAPEPVA